MPDKKKIITEIKNDFLCKTGKQTTLLYSSQIIVLFLGVFTGAINTRTLGPEGYGLLSFYVAFTSFMLLFFNFGVFSSSGYLIAREKEEKKRKEIYGASIIITLLIGITYSLFIIAASFYVDNLFKTQIGWILRYTSILLAAFPFMALITHMSKGSNKIWILSLSNVLPKTIYLVSILLLLKIIQPSYIHFIIIYSISIFISYLLVVASFKPTFTNLIKNLKTIITTVRTYGFYTYIGMIADQSSFQLSSILIPFFFGTTDLGFYSLAVTICSPMSMLSQALSISMFKDLVRMEKIPNKAIYYNLIWLVSCFIFLVVFGSQIISIVFTEAFKPVYSLIPLIGLAYLISGFSQPYYSFLSAKGKGVWIMKRCLFASVINMIGNLALIPLYGNIGAAYSTLMSMLAYFSGAYWYYRKYGKESLSAKIA